MIGVDTNILARLIARDDAGQAHRAAEFINKNCSAAKPAFISLIVLAELVWLLTFSYSYSKKEVAEALWSLLNSEIFRVENYDIALSAWKAYSSDKADFADYLVLYGALSAGADYVVSFDKRAAKEKGFFLLR